MSVLSVGSQGMPFSQKINPTPRHAPDTPTKRCKSLVSSLVSIRQDPMKDPTTRHRPDECYHILITDLEETMLGFIKRIFGDRNLDEIDDWLEERIKAVDERIAAKEAYLEKLKTKVEAKRKIVETQHKIIDRYQKTLKQGEN